MWLQVVECNDIHNGNEELGLVKILRIQDGKLSSLE